MRIVDYKIISGRISSLERDVADYLKAGWQPLGGAFYLGGVDTYQTMVKYEEEKNG